jgi:hypothetical protein
MARDEAALVPATVPFWLKPVSFFGLSRFTMFIKSSHMLTLPSTLAPLRMKLTDTPSPHGFGASHSTVGTLSEGFTRFVTLPRYLLEYY